MAEEGALLVRLRSPMVEVSPGAGATIWADITNTGLERAEVSLGVSGRASAWLRPSDGSELVHVPAGGTRSITLLARPPRSRTEGELVPFAVHAVESGGGRSSVTGLVVLVRDQLVQVSVVPSSITARRTATYAVELRSDSGAGVVALRVVPDAGGLRTSLDAPTVAVPRGAPVTVGLTVRAARLAVLAPVRHDVVVGWEVLGDGDGRGAARAVLQQGRVLPPAVTAVLLLLALLAVVVAARTLLGRDPVPFDLPGRGVGTASSTPDASAGSAATSGAGPAGSVTTPYAQLGAVPQGPDPDASRADAQARAEELQAAGVPGVRVVSAADLPDARPGAPPFWALVNDGFSDVAGATAFCRQHQGVAGALCVPSG